MFFIQIHQAILCPGNYFFSFLLVIPGLTRNPATFVLNKSSYMSHSFGWQESINGPSLALCIIKQSRWIPAFAGMTTRQYRLKRPLYKLIIFLVDNFKPIPIVFSANHKKANDHTDVNPISLSGMFQ